MIFMGSDNNGMPVPGFKNSSGTYHMSGCLEVAPEAFLRKHFSLVRRVLEVAGSATIICALALPRYVKRPCCNDENHMVNWAEADFNNILRGGSEACSPVIQSEGEKHSLTIAAFNPLSCFGQAEDLADLQSSTGLPIWREDDPVHLTVAAYRDIAAIISSQAETTCRQLQAGLARKRLASVVPAPVVTRQAVREPEWISGQLRSARGSQRGGNRAGFGGGQWRGRGSGPVNLPLLSEK